MSESPEMESFTVELTPYSTDWPRKFANEKSLLIARVLHDYPHRIEHIGSTSVEGATAKPIVDIAVRVESTDLVPELVRPLSEIGYRYMKEFGLPGRHFFIKGNPRAYHLHVVDGATNHWERWIKFRDTLKDNPALLEEYQTLKKDLAEKYRDRREQYTRAKSDFINAVLSDDLYGHNPDP